MFELSWHPFIKGETTTNTILTGPEKRASATFHPCSKMSANVPVKTQAVLSAKLLFPFLPFSSSTLFVFFLSPLFFFSSSRPFHSWRQLGPKYYKTSKGVRKEGKTWNRRRSRSRGPFMYPIKATVSTWQPSSSLSLFLSFCSFFQLLPFLLRLFLLLLFPELPPLLSKELQNLQSFKTRRLTNFIWLRSIDLQMLPLLNYERFGHGVW